MNQKQSKKIRKQTRLYWQKYLARFSALPFWERCKLAFSIVTLRANNGVQADYLRAVANADSDITPAANSR